MSKEKERTEMLDDGNLNSTIDIYRKILFKSCQYWNECFNEYRFTDLPDDIIESAISHGLIESAKYSKMYRINDDDIDYVKLFAFSTAYLANYHVINVENISEMEGRPFSSVPYWLGMIMFVIHDVNMTYVENELGLSEAEVKDMLKIFNKVPTNILETCYVLDELAANGEYRTCYAYVKSIEEFGRCNMMETAKSHLGKK